MSRVLGRTRISRSTEESTSLVRQRELIQRWADDNGHEIVGWAEDDGVSGSVDPWATPGLGPWLEDYDSWDILVAWKLDRLARRSIPLHRLFGFVQDNDKTLVCISDNLDLSHWVGRLVASVIAGVAEGELEAIRERASASKKKLRSVGRFSGGKPPYGYRKKPLEGGGFVLEQDPVEGPVVRWMVEQLTAGIPAEHVARQLREQGVPSPTGKKFSASTVRWQARRLSLVGYSTFENKAVRDDNGEPVRVAEEGICTIEEFTKLQEVLDSKNPTPRHHNASPLLGVAFCYKCGEAVYYAVTRKTLKSGRVSEHSYYRCRNRCVGGMNTEWLESCTYDQFLDLLGDHEQLVKHENRPVDHSQRIAELHQAIADLSDSLGEVGSAGTTRVLTSRIVALDKEAEALQKAQDASGSVTWESTGVTYRELFDAADKEGKRQIMLKAGIRVDAMPFHFNITVSEDVLERLTKDAPSGPSKETTELAREATLAHTQGKGWARM